MVVPVCDRPSVAEQTKSQDHTVMGTRSRFNSPENADTGTPTPHYWIYP